MSDKSFSAQERMAARAKKVWLQAKLDKAFRAHAGNGDIINMDHLRRLGADPDAKDCYGQTGLMLAAAQGLEQAVHYLVDIVGVNVLAENRHGSNAADLAGQNGFGRVAAFIAERIQERNLTPHQPEKPRAKVVPLAARRAP